MASPLESQADGRETFYVYGGVRHNTLDELVAAMDGADRIEHGAPTEEALEPGIHALFQEYAEPNSAGLQIHEFRVLAASLAAELGIDPRRFGDFSVIFHRFDVNGDAMIDEKECVMVAESMLRHYFHEIQPCASRGVGMLNLERKELESHYELAEKVGEGGEGAVYMAREKASGHERVVKFYDKSSANAPLEEIKDEFLLLRSLDHPKIQRLYDIFEDPSNVYVVAEPYRGGDLRGLVDNAMGRGVHVSTAWLAKIIFQVLQGVAYLHSRYVMHCDLKESNVMIVSDENWQEPSAVVIDFGLARSFTVRGSMGGTAGYLPPEVWTEGLWTPKGDVHALGVVLFQLFTIEATCFQGRGDKELMHSTLHTMPDFNEITRNYKRCTDLPPLVERMLCKDFRGRPTVRECMEDAFFTSRVGRCENDAEDFIPSEVVSALGTLSDRTPWQRAISQDIAARLNLAELHGLNEAFAAMDADHDGVITAEEVRQSLALTEAMDPAAIQRVVDSLVGGPDGKVAYTDFMGRLLASEAADANRLLWKEFQALDSQGSGFLRRADIAQLLDRPALAELVSGRGVARLMDLMDADGDGHVSFEEFRRTLGCEPQPLRPDSCGGARPPRRAAAGGASASAYFQVGQDLEYHSPSWKSWIPCKVVARNTVGAIQIDLKPGYWWKREEQSHYLRPAQL